VEEDKITDRGPDAGEPAPPAPPEWPVRGILWVIVPALLGAFIGPLAGVLYAGATNARLSHPPDYPVETEYAQYGTMVGGGIGLAVGLLIWVFFPYKGPAPGATPPTAGGAGEPDAAAKKSDDRMTNDPPRAPQLP
jgi:hypothetical protein